MCEGQNLSCRRLGLLAFALLTGCVLATGCSTLSGDKSADPADLAQEPVPAGSYVVEFQSHGQKPTVKNFALVGSPTIQDALEQSGALKKFSNLDIVLVRTVPGTQKRHKMKIDFDPKYDTVPPQGNYALRPNDHLIIGHGAVNPLDTLFGDSLSSLMGSR